MKMKMKDDEFEQKRLQLKEYAELDGCSYGDYCLILCGMASWRSTDMSPEFEEALVNEVLDHLNVFEKNCTIVETTDTITHTLRDLQWY